MPTVLAGSGALHPHSISAGLSAPPLRSLTPSVSVCCLPCSSLFASLQPHRRATLTPKCRSEVVRAPGSRREPLSPLSLFPGAAGAPAVTPPRRADGASEDPSGRISSLPFDRSFPIRSGFPLPLPRALPHPRDSRASLLGQGSPGSSRSLRWGLPLRGTEGWGAPWTS